MLKKITVIFCFILICTVLVGCNSLKGKLKHGVSDSFPDEIVYPKSTIYSYFGSDGNYRMGVTSKSDYSDIIEFYENLDENNNDIDISKNEGSKSLWGVEGKIPDKGIQFSINIYPAVGIYDATIQISIESIVEDNIISEGSLEAEENNQRPAVLVSELEEGFYIKRKDNYYKCGFNDEFYYGNGNAYMIPIADMTYEVFNFESGDTLIARGSYMPEYVYITPIVESGYTLGGMFAENGDTVCLKNISGGAMYLGDTDLYSSFLYKIGDSSYPIDKINDEMAKLSGSHFYYVTKDAIIHTYSNGGKDESIFYLGDKNEVMKFTYYSGMDMKSFSAKLDVCVFFHGDLGLGSKNLNTIDTDSMAVSLSYDSDIVTRAAFTLSDDGYIIIEYDFDEPGMYLVRAKGSMERYITTIINVIG